MRYHCENSWAKLHLGEVCERPGLCMERNFGRYAVAKGVMNYIGYMKLVLLSESVLTVMGSQKVEHKGMNQPPYTSPSS